MEDALPRELPENRLGTKETIHRVGSLSSEILKVGAKPFRGKGARDLHRSHLQLYFMFRIPQSI
jgi:hypothetical protein